MKEYKAKPTTFNGVTYKSKAEARMAVCFDAWGWQYEYENVSVGNWKPDFTVTKQTSGQSFVRIIEFKPCKPTGEYINTLADNFGAILASIALHKNISCTCELWCVDFWNNVSSGLRFVSNASILTIDEELSTYDFSPGKTFRFDLRSSSQTYDYTQMVLERMRRNKNANSN